jgi:hypothetical protein
LYEGNDDRSPIDASAYPFGEMGSSQLPLSLTGTSSRAGASRQKTACGNLINKGQLSALVDRGRNELDINQE